MNIEIMMNPWNLEAKDPDCKDKMTDVEQEVQYRDQIIRFGLHNENMD